MSEDGTRAHLYTGPLAAAAFLGMEGQRDPGAETVILLGLALDCSKHPGERIQVRMEMTPEDAEETALLMLRLAVSAKRRRA